MAESTSGNSFVLNRAEPQISFSTFILGLASTALIHLGEAPNPDNDQRAVDLMLAQQTLDVLEVLRAKTQGNLTADEEQLFQSLLTDLRLKFVQAAKA